MTSYHGKCHWNTWVHNQLLRIILEAIETKVTEINQGKLPVKELCFTKKGRTASKEYKWRIRGGRQ